MDDLISRQAAIDAVISLCDNCNPGNCGACLVNFPGMRDCKKVLEELPSAQPEIVRCKDCRYFKDITSIHGECECADMWQSLFGEVTEVEAIEVHKDHYCGYAERKTDEKENI